MEKDDHLDKETSVSLALNESGLELKSRSRTLAVIDRITGNFFERLGLGDERRTQLGRQRIEIEMALVERASQTLLKRVETDEVFALSILDASFNRDARRQLNKNGVVTVALEQLRLDPPSEAQNEAGPETLSEEFVDRFERYAEDASTDELRERWGRVLASEIKKPGTFSAKVMRVVDELDSEIAQAFEALMTVRLDNALPICLTGQLPNGLTRSLTSAELIVGSTSGQIRIFRDVNTANGLEARICSFHRYAVGIDRTTKIPFNIMNNGAPVVNAGSDWGVPVHLLTKVGEAIASILPDNQDKAFAQYIEKIRTALPAETIRIYEANEAKDSFALKDTLPPLSAN